MQELSLGPIAGWVHSSENGKARARVLIVHGLSEHSARHLNTVGALTRAGYDVVRFDLRGCGKSGGERQWVERFGDYVEDVSKVVNWIETQPGLPLYLLGHSMGGAIAIHFAASYGKYLSGLIVSAPAFRIGEVSPLKIAVGRVLEKVVPHLRIPKSMDSGFISRDPVAVEAYKNDPLTCHFNTLRQGKEILDGFEAVGERVKKIDLPIVLFHGSADRIVRLEGSFEILQTVPSKDKNLFILPGGFHEPHNDIEKEEYFRLLTHWIDTHAKVSAAEISPLSAKRAKQTAEAVAKAH